MRFNDSELATLSSSNADLEGRLNYRKTPSGNFSQSGSGFKERWFKLKYNLLFFFKINELGHIDKKPAGVFVLESAKVQIELSGGQFAFSITFRDDPDKKHIFSARSEGDVHLWVHSLKKSTYESLRNQLVTLQGKIKRITGKDPLLMYPRNKGIVRNISEVSQHQSTSSFIKATFQSHLRFTETSTIVPTPHHVPETNLIEL
ncbi:pleckstrin homology domain-containing family J member 1-like [Homalodisca vitripennis]|uniref:Pleckstrin homology domain-containing family J member 1 n=2 Tax=Homalodisca liturata TaxID=320908 RepID=A0A1B6IKF4_9HEMI|nr:pleckstrin homology domain-containing family J member 1-like [Homalodisca vitripennis]XP_046661795.1 pleckstrin homology domain-containing family J member 1-like [Homalodisca vitripennis]XP_046661797.1 pleckstrin homology domain-containing family J member 1-like [Homalodisca vitripennis]XP_046661798.1 pleckstrin homology domain-containing family J member 1-like [Homalodisca vitripennis]KAG8326986.1 Pleckstrin y domain-containing J member 1 [Homalodisca vitripennis]